MAHVVIQLGHCYRRSGATGTNGVDGDPNEQEFATAAGWRAAELLLAAGHSAGIILADDPAHLYAGDAFVAIHCDGSISDQARGASVGYRTEQGADLAAAWKRQYAAAGWSGFRPDNYTPALNGYYGTRTAVERGNRSAFIAEAGFLTNSHDEALLTPPDGADRFARALTNAVVEVFGGQPPETDMPLTTADSPIIEAAVTKALGFMTRQINGVGGAPDADAVWARYLYDGARNQLAGAPPDVDEAEVARLVLAGLPAEAIAAAIPTGIAADVVDELHRRTAPTPTD